MTDDAGQVVNEYSYTAYGDEETAVETVAQPFRYTSREYDPEIDLYYYRTRHYGPSIGRFLQEDKLWFAALKPTESAYVGGDLPTTKIEQAVVGVYAGELNIYRYVANNPVNFVDPTGEFGLGLHARAQARVQNIIKALNFSLKREFGLLKKNGNAKAFQGLDGRFIPNSSVGNAPQAALDCAQSLAGAPPKGLGSFLCYLAGQIARGGS